MADLIVFDLDDTLYLERNFVRSGFAAADAWLRQTIGVKGLYEALWTSFEQGVRGRNFDVALEAIGVAPAETLVRSLVEIYRHHAPEIALEADAAATLDDLAGRCPLALLTDGVLATQQLKIGALRLGRRFRPVVCTGKWGPEHYKPSPRGFHAIQAYWGVAPERCLYVADNPKKDFIAPRRLGWRTLRVRRPLGEHAGVEAGPDNDAEETVERLDARDLLRI